MKDTTFPFSFPHSPKYHRCKKSHILVFHALHTGESVGQLHVDWA